MAKTSRRVPTGMVCFTGWLSVLAAIIASGRAAEKTAQERSLERTAGEFAKLDRDGDRFVAFDEFLAQSPSDTTEQALRFARADFDRNGKLDRGEFHGYFAPPDTRSPIPDPIVELEQAALAKWQALFSAADSNADGALSHAEWPAEKLTADLPDLAGVTFEQADRNGDGQIDGDEGRWLLEVASGLTQLDGRPLRTPAGRVFSWYYFRGVDRNGDGVLSRNEFLTLHYEGSQRSAVIFRELDLDRNGQLTVEETVPLLWHDTLRHFFIFDRDGDGYLTAEELLVIGWGQSLARRTVPAFDDDGDGRLSFREFRLTTFANQASAWQVLRDDVDGDGRLSFQEFYQEKPPLLMAQSHFFFHRFDLDRDGFLTPDELEFNLDFRKLPPDAAFGRIDRDGDGVLSESEFIRQTGKSTAEANRDFGLFDRDGDGRLNVREFSTHPKMVSFDRRGAVSDPLMKLVERYLILVDNHWDDWDADHNGELNCAELFAGLDDVVQLPVPLSQLYPVRRDGALTHEEARAAIESLLGTRVLNFEMVRLLGARNLPLQLVGPHVTDSQSLRSPGGTVINLIHFRQLDSDGSRTLGASELGSLGAFGIDPVAALKECDEDQDGQLSLDEWRRVPVAGSMDPVNEFCDLDADFDGLVNRDELRKVSPHKLPLAPYILPGFDLDGDGKLSLAEYRFCPLGNPLVDWYRPIVARGGGLTFAQYADRSEPFYLLYWHYFQRFDVNSDGVLDHNEFHFQSR